MRKIVKLWALVCSVGLFALGGVLAPAPAQAEKFSAAVGKPLQAAQDAIKKKKWDDALAEIKKAQAVPAKTAYEQYTINEMLGYALWQSGDTAGAARAYEQNLSSAPAAEVPSRVKTLAQLNARAKNLPKAIEYGNRWIKASPNDTDAYYLVAQSYYQQRDCKNSVRVMQNGIDAARRSGQAVKENWLTMKLYCQTELNDKDGISETREQLVRNFPSRENWERLLATVIRPENEEATSLGYYRLMFDLDVLNEPGDYVDMSEIAIASGVPAEAVTVMEKGFANRILENKDKERHTRLLNNAKTHAQTSRTELPNMEKEARAAKSGEADVNVGIIYMSFGQYDKAVEALQRGLQKGAHKRTAEAQIMLGRAYLKLNQKDAARRAFKAVPDDSKLARVAELYDLHAAQS
jgi:tetratricopeptide (TPR) repeat protein